MESVKSQAETISVRGHYVMTCTDAAGRIKWVEEFDNLVTNVGKTFLLDTFFKGTTYTAAWYMGLVNNTGFSSYNASDTMASHAGWTEFITYTLPTRPAILWNSASASGGGAGSAGTGTIVSFNTTFNINAVGDVNGAFITTNSTKSGTTGTLFSASSFATGNRTVIIGDVINVAYTFNC